MRCTLAVLLLALSACTAPPVALAPPVAPTYAPPQSGLIHSRAGWPAHWPEDAFPIRLLVPEDMPPGWDIPIYMTAQTWNVDVGAEVFRVEHVAEVPEPEEIPVGVCTVELAMLPGHVAGVTRFTLARWTHPDPGRLGRCHIGLDPRLRPDVFGYVVRHELGHAVGLADVDDETSSSIMRGRVPENVKQAVVPLNMVDWIRHQMGLDGTER